MPALDLDPDRAPDRATDRAADRAAGRAPERPGGQRSAPRSAERLVVPLDRARFGRDALDATVAYLGVADAPPGTARTRRERDGSIVLSTSLEGTVRAVGEGRIELDRRGARAALRHVLPEAVELGALAGADVRVETCERLHGGRCTADARILDASGRLLLWAHDGELPEDRAAHGLALRMRMAEAGPGLAIAHRSGLAIVRGPGLALVEDDGGTLLFVALRTGGDEVAFVALRR